MVTQNKRVRVRKENDGYRDSSSFWVVTYGGKVIGRHSKKEYAENQADAKRRIIKKRR